MNYILDILDIGENVEIEFKKAKNSVPKSLWETYSAMANTSGGCIILGVEEGEDLFISGVNSAEKVVSDFWNTLNSEKVSKNILTDENVNIIDIDNKKIIKIDIPKANYLDKPIYINSNPYIGTYKRNFEGDYRCSKEEINAMIRDSSDKGYDSTIIEGYDINDVDFTTLKKYRNRFVSRNINHIWNEVSDEEFLINLGALVKNRKNGDYNLSVAGLLMFGKGISVREFFPYINFDYRDVSNIDENIRYNDRFTIDGTWENNIYNFYMSVIVKISEEIAIPFRMEKMVRVDDTPVHEALREAFVNAIVHADYSIQGCIEVLKYKDRIEFSNPGTLKIPIEDIYNGGISKARNPKIRIMLRMIGFGENIGSGFPKILYAWSQQKWKTPELEESTTLNKVSLKLSMISLVSETSVEKLEKIYGSDINTFDEFEIQALIAATKGEISNSSLQCITNVHPKDITVFLKRMVNNKLLIESGIGRGKKYKINDNYAIEKNTTSLQEELFNNMNISSEEKQIISLIKKYGFTTRSINEEFLDLSKDKSYRLCKNLISIGLVEKKGNGRSTKYVLKINDK